MTDYQLNYPGGELPLPTIDGTEDPSGFDVSALLKTTGRVALDVGFVNTASCKSAITYIDGDAGILRYRGYPIDQLAEKSTFLEVSYLLINGELPTPEQLTKFTDDIRTHTLLHEEMKRFFEAFPRDAHPMAVLSSGVSAISTFYQDSLDPFDQAHVDLSSVRLMAKLPTIASYAYKKSVGQPFLYPDNRLDYVSNFLRMTFGFPVGGLRGRPDRGQDAGHAVHPARRPRAETVRHRRCAWSARPTPTCSRRCRPASTRCSARCTVARTSRCSRC